MTSLERVDAAKQELGAIVKQLGEELRPGDETELLIKGLSQISAAIDCLDRAAVLLHERQKPGWPRLLP